MQEITDKLLEKETFLLYIHTPFCGTCHIARLILTQIESVLQREVFYEMNASFYPNFMEEEEIRSVPCLYIKVNGEVKEIIYTFHTTANIVHYLNKHIPSLFKE